MLDDLIDYEQGDLDLEATLRLFAHLIRTGAAWSLQGHYGRTAAGLIEAGIIDHDGVIDWPAVGEES